VLSAAELTFVTATAEYEPGTRRGSQRAGTHLHATIARSAAFDPNR
jgi:hypothetical protein